jgi:hypothetical protein
MFLGVWFPSVKFTELKEPIALPDVHYVTSRRLYLNISFKTICRYYVKSSDSVQGKTGNELV